MTMTDLTYERIVPTGWLDHHGSDEEVVDLLRLSIERLTNDDFIETCLGLGMDVVRERMLRWLASATEKKRMSFVRKALYDMRVFETKIEKVMEESTREAEREVRIEEQAKLDEEFKQLLAERDWIVKDSFFELVTGDARTYLTVSYEGRRVSPYMVRNLRWAVGAAQRKIAAVERSMTVSGSSNSGSKKRPATYAAKKSAKSARDSELRRSMRGSGGGPTQGRRGAGKKNDKKKK